jgi:hypothetical protein
MIDRPGRREAAGGHWLKSGLPKMIEVVASYISQLIVADATPALFWKTHQRRFLWLGAVFR